MFLLGFLLLVVSVKCAEKEYFHIPTPRTWDIARQWCQTCYKDLTTITSTNAEVIGLNLSSDYWIGLRKNMSGLKFWSRWANGEPVLYQNWYPGHPVLKKKPQPQPTCSPAATADVMQCPNFTKLSACLNSSGGKDEPLFPEESAMFNTSINNTSMWCPAMAKICDCLNSPPAADVMQCPDFTKLSPCLNSSGGNDELLFPEESAMFNTSINNTSMWCRALAKLCDCLNSTEENETCMSSPTNTTSSDLEPEYIENSCVALLSFGMWQEKQCKTSLPYICYDEQFYGDVEVSNETQSEAFLNWSKAGVNISQYRLEINGKQIKNVTDDINYQITGLHPGELYRVQVIPVRCGRDLNPQNISFYTLPEEIQTLTKVSVETDKIILSWKESNGTNVSYLVNTQPGNLNTTCCPKNCSISKLQPGQMYNFTVKAVVNETSFGKPGFIHVCTKPSKLMNLTSSNNDSNTITATWDSPDSNSVQYTYNVTLDNIIHISKKEAKTITLTNITSGSKYTLNVFAILPACSEAGEPASISAYTTPMPVTTLKLNSTNDSITATWEHQIGGFSWFYLTISSTMSENNRTFSNTTTNLTYTFKHLVAAALYTVSVITYVEKDLNPSQAVKDSIYTRPNSPGKAMVKTLNSTAVCLRWEVPENTQLVININYSVNYTSDFWQDNGNLSLIGNTSVIIGGLKPGTKYNFNIKVLAGTLESRPSVTSGLTEPVNRMLTLALLCSSSTLLYCMNNSTEIDFLEMIHNRIQENFKDNIFWNLTLHNRN